MRDERGAAFWGIEVKAARRRDRHCILAVLPRGEAIRNFVYSGALDELESLLDVVILSVDVNRSVRSIMENHARPVLNLTEVNERWLVRFVRELLDLAHGRWLWSQAARERWRLRDLEAASISRKVKRWTKKAISLPFARPKGLEALSALESLLAHVLRTTDRFLDLLSELRPSLVFNGSHVHGRLAVPVIHAARRLKVPTATFIFSWDNLTSQGRIIPTYDYYLTWNETMRDQLLRIYPGISPNQVFVTGTPQFDFHLRPEYYWSREDFCKRIGADPRRPLVLYSTGMANHMPGEPLIVANLANMLRTMRSFGPPQLVVRVYPKDRTGRFEGLKRQLPDVLFPDIPWDPNSLTPEIDDCYLLTNMLKHCAVGVNVASTISLELCMFDKPVINIGYNPPGVDIYPIDYARYYQFDHYRLLVESGAVCVARTEDELKQLLEGALEHPERCRQQRRALIRRFFGDTLDGRSASRVAARLLELAQGR